jgi:hypothetical protein
LSRLSQFLYTATSFGEKYSHYNKWISNCANCLRSAFSLNNQRSLTYFICVCFGIVVSKHMSCFVFLHFVNPMLPVFLDCRFVIAHSVFSNVQFAQLEITILFKKFDHQLRTKCFWITLRLAFTLVYCITWMHYIEMGTCVYTLKLKLFFSYVAFRYLFIKGGNRNIQIFGIQISIWLFQNSEGLCHIFV